MHSLICEMIHYKKNKKDKDSDEYMIKGFMQRYDDILDISQKEYEDNPPGKYYREGYNLYMRLRKYKEYQLLFLNDKRVPADNSLAERQARVFKRKQKQAIVFRSSENLEYLCDGLSLINTYRHRNVDNLYDMIAEIFSRPKPQKKKPTDCT